MLACEAALQIDLTYANPRLICQATFVWKKRVLESGCLARLWTLVVRGWPQGQSIVSRLSLGGRFDVGRGSQWQGRWLMLKTVRVEITVRGGQWISVHPVEVSGKTCRSQWMKKAARDWVEVGAWSSWMTWVWGLGPELLQVKRRLPPEGGDPYSVSHIPVSGRRWVSLLFNSTGDYLPINPLGTE